jgi:glycosyltransferase involved in cell wall biosynthesis
MENSLVSICIPTYNGQEFLEPCLQSAINQTYPNIEIVIVDDCSADNTNNIIVKYAARDTRIKIFRNEKNLGLVGNFNRCIQVAQGDWIKFLLQDDYLTDNCIETMLAGISEQDRIVACKRTFLLDEDMLEDRKRYYETEVVTFEKLGIISKTPVFITPKQVAAIAAGNICMNFIGEPTSVMFRKDIVNKMGYFNNDLAQICDLEYFLRIGSTYGIKYMSSALSYFRIHKQSTTSTNVNAKFYVLAHIDPIITTYQLLFEKCYSILRDNLSFRQKIKLKLYFLIHVYESYITAQADKINLNEFEVVAGKYPKIRQYKNGSLFIRILLKLIKAKRKSVN